jgi:hypothetical protein
LRVDVVPHTRVGPVELGMSPGEIAKALGIPPDHFNKTTNSQWPTDTFFGNVLQVFYSGRTPIAEYIEVSAGGELSPVVFGLEAFSTPASDVIRHITASHALGESGREAGYTFVFPDIDLSFWRPVMPQDDDDPEGKFFSTIGIGAAGYYQSASG